MPKRSCDCGCDHFRFKITPELDGSFITNLCRNCNHALAQHLELASAEE